MEIEYAIEEMEDRYAEKVRELRKLYPRAGQVIADMFALQHEITLRECEWMVLHRNDGRSSRHTVAVRSRLAQAATARPLTR